MSKPPSPPERPAREGPSEIQNTAHAVPVDSGLLAQQFYSLNVSLEKLNAAIVSLKPQSQSNDKKTAFWKAYKTLVDEFDEDFQRKYGNDLDSALIFAGLFSAVSSAFIIQIQPDLLPNPNATIQELLGILVQNMTGTAVPDSMADTPPPVITVVAQSLLYISLFMTLMAALLAVLGKQWLLHYDSVGERGTIEERGLERQRKFDGLQRWKFDLVMQLFPLLLQLALLLFAFSLSLYLRTVNLIIAAIILSLTIVGFILHAAMVISALLFPDSPFQTSLTTLLGLAITIPIPQSLHKVKRPFRNAFQVLRGFLARAEAAYSSLVKTVPPLLPQSNKFAPSREPSSPQLGRIFDQIPPASKEVSAIVWALETSTDPKVVEAAAALAPSLQWPVDLDLRQSLKRLSDTFNQCLDHRGGRRDRHVLLEGMRDRCISSIKAFGVLEMVSDRREAVSNLWSFEYPEIARTDAELQSVVRFFRVPHLNNWFFSDTPPITQWSLRFISGQNPPEKHLGTILKFFRPNETSLKDLTLLADFVFCINSFFVSPNARDLSVIDKSEHHALLITLLFENLANRLVDPKPLDLDVAKQIVARILGFQFNLYPFKRNSRSTEAVYRFCAVSGTHSALRLVRLDDLELYLINPFAKKSSMADVAWAYNALEQLDGSQPTDPAVIGDLLQVPLHYGHVLARPTPAVFRAIIWAISCDSRRTNQLACHHLLLPSVHHCFDDNELRPLLQQNSTWTSLALVLVQAPVLYPPDFMFPMTAQYIALGDKISQTPDWNPVITQDLPGWLSTLTALLGGDPEGEPRRSFCRVLSRLWDAGESESEQFGDEKALVMSFTALANAWDRFDFSNSQTIQPLMRLIECTVSTAFCARLVDEFRETVNNPSPRFKDIVMPRLGDAVGRAVQMLNPAVNPDLIDVANRAAEILSKLASTINGELKSRPPADKSTSTDSRMEVGYWKRLQTEFEQDIKALPGFVQKTSLTVEVPDI